MTRTRYGVSPWIDQVPKRRRPDYPRFQGTQAYSAVIVGGGLAGAMTAYAFAAAGVKVALLEAGRIGLHGGGRAPGVLRGEAAPSYRDIEARHGRKAARSMYEATRRAVLDLATTARRLGVRGGVDAHSALRVLASPFEEERPLARDVALRRDAGLDAVWLKSAAAVRESGIDRARAAVRLRDWGTANPYHLVTAFCAAAAKRGAAVFEQSSVRRVRARRKDVEIHAERGVLTAGTVIICTGEPTDLFRSLKRHVRYDEKYVVLTDRIPAVVRRRLAGPAPVVTDTDSPPHIVRWTDEGHIVVAGADQPRPAPRNKEKVLVQRTGQLMYELSRMYPDISGVMPIYGWDLPVAATADGVMYAGPHRNYPHHLFAWATAHDPAHAFLASRILLRHYLSEPDRADAYFAFTR
jgi:glycine/D-amino acid oxidase-like deaminating enzyme